MKKEIAKATRAKRSGTTTISNMVICNYNNLSDAAFRLYCILAMLGDKDDYGYVDGSVSVKMLADISDKTPETVQMLLKELIDNELIDWTALKLLDSTKWLNTPSQFGLCGNLEHFLTDYDPHFGYFSMVDEILGIVVFPDAYRLYRIFAMLAGEEVQVNVNIKELSKLFNDTPKKTRKWFQVLVDNGIIEVIAPDTYIIHDAYRDTLEA